MNQPKKSHLFQKGQPSANPRGRPKKPRLPSDVSKILETQSPAIMQLACDLALGMPDKHGQRTEKPNTRILNTLLDKIKPSLKSVEYRGQQQLPTMILVGNNTPTDVLNAIKDSQSNMETRQVIDVLPEEKDKG